jgi:hypothetical protein
MGGNESDARGTTNGRSSTFLDNLARPIHRWFRYSAGFSAGWVRDVIEREKAEGRTRLLDPFVGSGTTVLEAEAVGIDGIGVEAHPFIYRVARTKLLWRTDPKTFAGHAEHVLDRARHLTDPPPDPPPLLAKCFPAETLHRLTNLRRAGEGAADGSPAAELTWLTLAAILRECSPVGTAQWQYVLPRKSKARALDPFAAFRAKVATFAADMAARQRQPLGPTGRILADDARVLAGVPDRWADLVVTSPPYANNYDYADATRLEMTFFGEIDGWGQLQDAVRRHLVRACTQHVAPIIRQTDELVADPILAPVAPELAPICAQLATVREDRGGKKPYHTMVAAYFRDMAQVWHALRRVAADGCRVCFVIGDSAPYGVYVPVDRWLGELAVAAGFQSFRFEKTRDRNVKWKNRKHRVPLHEGRLWVEG